LSREKPFPQVLILSEKGFSLFETNALEAKSFERFPSLAATRVCDANSTTAAIAVLSFNLFLVIEVDSLYI
jgi:hypothetical protein